MGRNRKKNRHLPQRMQLKNGRYYYTPYLEGKLKWISLGSDFGAALVEWARREQRELKKGTSFDDLVREFELRVVPKWKNGSRQLWKYWKVALLSTFTGVELGSIRATHVYAHVEKREREEARSSGLRERTVLSSMLGKAVEWDWIQANPCIGVRIAGDVPRDRYLTDDEFGSIYEKANPTVRVTMEIGYLTGLRIGDLLKLKKSDITDQGLRVVQGKNNVRAVYQMTPDLRAALDRAKALKTRNGTLNLIAKRNGAVYTYYGFRSLWKRACDKAKVADAHFHDIRAKAITDAKSAGRDPQEFSQHKSREQAEAYVKQRQFATVVPLQIRSKLVGK